MYQSGKGVARDWHLAKRYYDLSRETGEEAGLAVWFSLWGLYLQRYANTSFFAMLPYFSFICPTHYADPDCSFVM